jgi:BirA family transcriptional regulator, biotin operon repressor / biotin---[acetyl-CoA-carboxylase] ligase
VTHPIRTVLLDAAGSTNREAFERARAGEVGPLWVVARRQTDGRGRNGRPWASEPGNLYASLLLRLAHPNVQQLALVAGVAVLEAIVAAAWKAPIKDLRLKWPNDVLIAGAKCAGILCESQASVAERVVVIGIGINLNSHPLGIGRAATDLAAHGLNLTPQAMLAGLDAAMARWLAAWDGGAGFHRVRAAWLAAAGGAGESLTVNTGAEEIAGTFVDLDPGGGLVLRDSGGALRTLTFGDVTLLPPPTPGDG